MSEKRSKKGPILAGMVAALLMLVGIGGGGIGDGLLPSNKNVTDTTVVKENVQEVEPSMKVTVDGERITVVYEKEDEIIYKEVSLEELEELLQTKKTVEVVDKAAIKKTYDEVIELIDKNEVTKIIK